MKKLRKRIIQSVLLMLAVTVGVSTLPPQTSDADDTPTIKVVAPHAGDVLLMGGKMKIRWKSSVEAAAHVRLELLRAGGLCTVIDAKTRNDGKAKWIVPHHLESDVNYAVRVIALTPSHTQGKSRGNFSIMGAGMP